MGDILIVLALVVVLLITAPIWIPLVWLVTITICAVIATVFGGIAVFIVWLCGGLK